MSQLILFQGDSITDVSRNRENDVFSGHGYATFIKGRLGYEAPGQYECLNRGISGNRIVDLYARIKADLINLRPDILSSLIGVNDVWHEITRQNGVEAERFERVYDMLLDDIQAALPNIRVMILEPFVLPGHATCNTEEIPDRLETFQQEVPLRAAAAKRVAEKHGAVFIPLQRRFDEASRITGPAHWLHDGVHPTAAGPELITRAWLEAFKQL